jgi:light-regulated signal transduction histidine kinase (bacteriophytochrome)
VSPAIKALSSHSPQEWVADVNLCLRLVHPEDLPILRSILEGTVPAGGTFTLRFVRASGETVWTEHRTTTVMGADGRPAALEGIARDISRQVEASQKVQSFNRELERRVAERTTRLDQATREMEEFCYTISHDFKGPLRAINGYTHILEESCGQHSGHAERGLTMQKIKKAAAHMGELMDLLLELGRISRVPFAQESVDVTALCRRITLKLQERDPGRNAIFTVADEMTATADPAMLERLLQILLENAWNFTAAKPAAVIEVNRVVTDRMVVFNVRDNGVGFNMAYAANLFKPFQRLHRPEEHGGMGMGLAVARRIVERHGGRIWGEGEPGEGATFYFTLS